MPSGGTSVMRMTVKTMNRHHLAIAALSVAVGLTVAACGGGSGSNAQVSTKAGAAAVVTTHGGPSGPYLTDGKGRTLYLFAADVSSTSTCTGQCASVWTPFSTSGTPTTSGSAKPSLVGTSQRSDGKTQVTYAGH